MVELHICASDAINKHGGPSSKRNMNGNNTTQLVQQSPKT